MFDTFGCSEDVLHTFGSDVSFLDARSCQASRETHWEAELDLHVAERAQLRELCVLQRAWFAKRWVDVRWLFCCEVLSAGLTFQRRFLS